MASLASVASGIVFSRIMISPLATIPVDMRQSTRSLGTRPSNLATETRIYTNDFSLGYIPIDKQTSKSLGIRSSTLATETGFY